MKNRKAEQAAVGNAVAGDATATGPAGNGGKAEGEEGNAPAVGPGELMELPLGMVIPTPDNARRFAANDPRVAELAESIRTKGQLVPAIARPHPTQPGKYDLRAGEMRYRGLKLLGRPTILVIVRPLSDREAMEVTVLENLQRNDLRPLEEARGVARLLADGRDCRTVAAQLGKSAAWVCRREALAALAPCWQELAEAAPPAKPGRKKHTAEEAPPQPDQDEDDLEEESDDDNGAIAVELSVAHLELLARFPQEVQEQLYKRFTVAERWYLDGCNFQDFQRIVNAEILGLKGSTFDLADATLLPAAGACTGCVKRASVNPGLFDEVEVTATNDRCLDRACFERKSKAALDRKQNELRAQYPGLVLVRSKYSSDPAILRLPEVGKHEWSDNRIVKEGTANAVPALIVHGPGAGDQVWMVKQKRNEQTGKMETAKPKTLMEKRHELELKRRLRAVDLLKKDLPNKLGLWQEMSWERRGALLVVFPPQNMVDQGYGENKYKSHAKLAGNDPAAVTALWTGVVNRIQAVDLKHYGALSEFDDSGRAWSKWLEAISLCTVLGINLDKYCAQAEVEIPEPKSWAAEAKAEAVVKAAKKKGGKGNAPVGATAATEPAKVRTCRVCGCTEADCGQCIEKTGEPCHWVEKDLCSACKETGQTGATGGNERE